MTGPPVRAIHGGIETQRAALLDDDSDGLANLAESIGGTRPDRWDTDGDGVWDGAPVRPDGARPLPLDGRNHCLGVAGPADVVVTWIGPDRVKFKIDDVEVPADVATTLTVSGPMVARSNRPAAGGAWVRVEGGTPSTDGCVERAGFTLRVLPGATADLAAIEKRILSVQKVAGRKGFVVHPFSLDLLDTGKVSVAGRWIGLSAERAAVPGGIELVVASVALGDLDPPPLGARLALAVELGAPVAFLDGWKREAETTAWTEARTACATGWAGLIDGSCARPP